MEIQSSSFVAVTNVGAAQNAGRVAPGAPQVPAAQVSPAASAPSPAPSREAVESAVNHANQVLSARVVDDLQFSVDQETNIHVVKLIDRKSGETVVQMPSAEMLKIAKSIDQFVGGTIQKTA